jgi:dihydroxy-acid dehydratase
LDKGLEFMVDSYKKPSDIWLDSSTLKHLTVCSRAGVLGALGWAEDEIRGKPIIGIVNSCTEMNPGHIHLDKIAAIVKQGVLQAGGIPMEFNIPGPCDAFSCGLDPMKYILPQRDVLADSVEMMVRCNSLDGLVFLASCDKIVPAELMASARLRLPAIFVCGGPMLTHAFFAPKDREAHENYSNYMSDGDEKRVKSIFDHETPGAGACDGFGTANTMQCLTESLGMSLDGSATIHAVDASKYRSARASGRRIVEMVREGLSADRILTRDAFLNAISTHTAMGGSSNAVIHLLAIAHELEDTGVKLDIDDFDEIGRKIPCIVGVNPNGPYAILDLHRAGGIPAVMKRIEANIKGSAMTINGKTRGELLKSAVIYDDEVVRPLNNPFETTGSLVIMRGNLAPEGAVIKQSAVRKDMRKHTGAARVFNSEIEVREGIESGKVGAGDVIVIRYEGPKGGPGMREMLAITRYLVYSGKGDDIALVTDGRFSGFTAGPAVGHVCPEAAEGGPIALVEDGDQITIDIPARTLTLHVDDVELHQRKAAWKPLRREISGFLKRYARDVVSANKGAWLKND